MLMSREEYLEKQLSLYQKAINKIDDRTEYAEPFSRSLFEEVAAWLTEELKKLEDHRNYMEEQHLLRKINQSYNDVFDLGDGNDT